MYKRQNEQFGEIRTALIENEPWFVAVDVCRALEIGNSSQAISRLDADEKMITLISNEGNKRGNPNMTVVNEPGIYTLIPVSYTQLMGVAILTRRALEGGELA